MSNQELKDIWGLMSKYKFEVVTEVASDSVSCLICKHLMIDACQSVCGCRYCHGCIIGYVGDGAKYCPGGKDECQEEFLVMERDVTRMVRINHKIARLKVVCPNESCNTTTELARMCEHIAVCSKECAQCPYTMIGCKLRKQKREEILSHVAKDSSTHSQLLMDFINDLKMEVDGWKEYVENNKLEMISLKEKSRLKTKFHEEIVEQVAKQGQEIKRLRKSSRQKNAQLKMIIEQILELKTELFILKNGSLEKENKIMTLESELRQVRCDMEGMKNGNGGKLGRKRKMSEPMSPIESRTNDSLIVGDRQRVLHENTLTVKSEMVTEGNDLAKNNWIQLCWDKSIDFVWKINEVSKKRETMTKKRIFSESFYSNNYKLCLCLYMDSGDRMSLCCYIMMGDHDQEVAWPMRRSVTFNIVDQVSLAAHKTGTCHYDSYEYGNAFDRPQKDMNDYGIGIWPFTDYESISRTASVLVNDSVVVSCVLSDP